MTIFYCPKTDNVCACKCCLLSGCQDDTRRAQIKFKCKACEEIVSAKDFLLTMCKDCALAAYIGANAA